MSENLDKDISIAIGSVAKQWKKLKKKSDKNDRMMSDDIDDLIEDATPLSVKEAAFEVMDEAYMRASGDGRYYANARQIMYAARPRIIELTGNKTPWKNSSYFTQNLLKSYIEENEPDWKVVWDSRGHFREPHTGKNVELGGRQITRYINNWKDGFEMLPQRICDEILIETAGPRNRFASVLFIEKEGFDEIFKAAGISKKFDIAVMSTKGIPVDAACNLLSTLEMDYDIQIFALHDFDLAGFKIVKTLEEGTRLSSGVSVIDLGFRLSDIERLENEPVVYKQKKDPRIYLKSCGATKEEQKFLVSRQGYESWYGNRVELNAMTSEQLIRWLENKLENHGVEKYVPESEDLEFAYKRAYIHQNLDKKVQTLTVEWEKKAESSEIPTDLGGKVKQHFEENSTDSWDNAIWKLVKMKIDAEAKKEKFEEEIDD